MNKCSSGGGGSSQAPGGEDFSIATPADAKAEDEFSNPDREDMLSDSPVNYPVWIKGATIQVNSANKDDVLGDGGSIKYEPASGSERAKLTLTNLHLDHNTSAAASVMYGAIYAEESIDLVLNGDNVINHKSVEGSSTDALEGIYGIGVGGTTNRMNISGEGSLTINIDAEQPTKNLRELYGIFVQEATFGINKANININIHGYATYSSALANVSDIIDSNISTKSHVGYNTRLGLSDYEGAVANVDLGSGKGDLSIKSSNINLHIEPREGLTVDEGKQLRGITCDDGNINISGNTTIKTVGTGYASIWGAKLNLRDNYKIDLDGGIIFGDNDQVGINFENISQDAYLITRTPYVDEVLICLSNVAQGKANFNIPSNAQVIAGASEAAAVAVSGANLNKLFYYGSNPAVKPGITFIKVSYKNNTGGGGSSGGGGGGSSGGGRSSGGRSSSGGSVGPAKQGGAWVRDNIGWWYRNADGSFPKATWQKINSAWYAFDSSGYMITGWYNSGGLWYYLSESGAMSTGWIQVGGKWYYLEPVGRADMPQGGMYANTYTPDGYWVNYLGEWDGY